MKHQILFLGLFTLLSISLFAQSDSLIVDEAGNVGIGIESPQAKLDVDGRIRDETGFVMPVGSILAFAGLTDKVPDGWLVCDGRSLLSTEYPYLYSMIGTLYGDGSTDGDGNTANGDFNLPDLRGQFLRGADLGAGVDPDANTRTYKNGTVVPENNEEVGSKQSDQIKSHNHSVRMGGGNSSTYDIPYVTKAYDSSKPDELTTYTGGLESRPKNVAVNYIIKY